MPESRLHEAWSIGLPLPEPFNQIIASTGSNRYSVKEEDCSVFNKGLTGRMATLHPPTLAAILSLAEIMEEGTGAVGIQLGMRQQLNFYCMEYEVEEERYALVYNPLNGRFKGTRMLGEQLLAPRPLRQGESTGEEYIALLAYASIQKGYKLFDEEFYDNFVVIQSQMRLGWKSPEKTLHAAFICCDNLYRRIEWERQDAEGVIPLDHEQFDKQIEAFPDFVLQSGIYAPSSLIQGEFLILGKRRDRTKKTIAELKRNYLKERAIHQDDIKRIPNLPEEYCVLTDTQEILDMIVKTPARIFMITGVAGIGKTTDAQMVAQILGLPYYFFTCGPGTDETELLATMLPNTGRKELKEEELPSYEDMIMDPASALAKVSGIYKEGIDANHAFSEIIKDTFKNGYEQSKAEKDFVLNESAIIQACRRPALIEIQEPSMIEKSGTLTKLNALFDDNAAADLLNGERVMRHPDTVVILTTNLNYIGCQMFNQSVLSRMNLIQHRPDLTEEEMVERILQSTNCTEIQLLQQMALIIKKIQGYLRREEIQDGVCSFREYKNWVWNYMISGNAIGAAISSVVSKAALEEDDRKEIIDSYILPYFTEKGGNE